MKLVKSNQTGVFFAFCPSPVTIDKRDSWGEDETNFQKGPDGAFLKMNSKDGRWEVSHLVQPNEDGTAPVGWIQGENPYLFDKQPIWVDDSRRLEAGEKVEMETLDGPISYDVTEPSYVTYNGDENGPNKTDGWVQSEKDLLKNYQFQA